VAEQETQPDPQTEPNEPQLERGTYEIIQNRLKSHASELQTRLQKLNDERRNVFGAIPTELVSKQRITTAHNCTARDIVPIGDKFLFGYNVQLGLKSVTELADVFSVYRFEDGSFHEDSLDLLSDKQFQTDFTALYKYYKDTRFAKFHIAGPYLYLVFRTGKAISDIKTFKFVMEEKGLKYVDNRSDHEVKLPPQHDFKWQRTSRELHRDGVHPHISIEDRVFVETVGGDLTVKVEDNTEDGSGIYAEPVDDPDQTLDDAEIYYGIVGNIILMKIRPFKEEQFRHVVFNEKTQSAQRLDSVAESCIFLPEDHGIIFANGYYLQTGQNKTFDSGLTELKFERRIASPNGEDYLYAFYNQSTGEYALLMYNVIEQRVDTPILCNGFSIFDNGHLIYFKADEEPQKHHGIQIWQTPFVADESASSEETDSYIFKIGNKEIVRAMAEAHEIMNLIDQDDSYANLYVDIVKRSTDIIDANFWLKEEETFNLAEPLESIREAATAAVDEFEKVVRIRNNTAKQFKETTKEARDVIRDATSRQFKVIDDFVQSLSSLRTVRGQVISLKELKYVDLPAVEALEAEIGENTDRLSHKCVEFLLDDAALAPYQQRVAEQNNAIEGLKTGVDAKELDEAIVEVGNELEMLIEIVSNLKIDDPTQRTRIIDNISTIYSSLNSTRASIKKKSQELFSVEGKAEFNSQIKLISQAVVNYLDVCDAPEKCDEYLTKMMVQVEEIEGRFAEFDEFVVELAEKREEIYAAFDTKKLQLVEARNKRATALMSAAERILKGIRNRVANFESVDEINSYFSSDLMIDKVRDIVSELEELEESVKVDDIQSRLKTVREDTIRQLRDKNELYVDGQNIIQFGTHKFSVNVQPLDLTTVIKDGDMHYHLSGTNYFETVVSDELNATKGVWDQSVVSEDKTVYRGEFLAWQMLRSSQTDLNTYLKADEKQRLETVSQFMAPRYSEGYVKGVHDHDATLILGELAKLHLNLGLLKYSPEARALALVRWMELATQDPELCQTWEQRLVSLGTATKLFGSVKERGNYIASLQNELAGSNADNQQHDPILEEAAEYLYEQLASGGKWPTSKAATVLGDHFTDFVAKKKKGNDLADTLASESLSIMDRFRIACDWVEAYVDSLGDKDPHLRDYIQETAAILIEGNADRREMVSLNSVCEIEGLLGDHPRINSKVYELDYHDFAHRLTNFESQTVPAYEAYTHLKKDLVADRREQLRLSEFKPRVLTSFVRNKLINDTYLPMIGANLAKQMGVVGEEKRTDLMGLLLLISPPGYGKTTLMEYVANRLGITFMKINGPAIGHQVTSLDPQEAPNASAREEVEKLNLALEMGDNVMIYVDDIQHCNPEFLQKFISLCDATRRIEGVFGGKSKTYDLRGRKVAVVMAGNPYTESGEKFQIPDMLASRADTYNLGDVIGGNADSFELSYLENCLTSNSTLARLNSKSREDVYRVIKMAANKGAPTESLEGNYSVEEVNEFVSVMRKLLKVRDVVLQVNQLYIESAAQADEYRTEPAFKLQGSYRDMNKIAEQIRPVMNDEELLTLIRSHYNNQAQTLTTGAQANLLKLKELMGELEGEEFERWEDIRRTFQRNLLLSGASEDDGLGRVIAQMTTVSDGLISIKKAVESGMGEIIAASSKDQSAEQIQIAVAELNKFNKTLTGIKKMMKEGIKTEGIASSAAAPPTPVVANVHDKGIDPIEVEVINKVPTIFLDIIRNQFRVLQTWMDPILAMAEQLPEARGLSDAARVTERNYSDLLEKIKKFKEDNPSDVE
jgi:hypothetical protein